MHFNFGLHDLKRVDEDGRNSNDPEDLPQASVSVYQRQLRAIAESILASGATPIFCTTTPVPEGEVRPHRDPEDVGRYNRAGIEVMTDLGIAVVTLDRFAADRIHEIQRPGNVHFTSGGSSILGQEVASRLRSELRRPRDP